MSSHKIPLAQAATAATTYPDDLTKLQRVADSFDVNERTVRRWIAEGKLPAYRVAGRALRVSRADVANLVRTVPTLDNVD